MADIVIVKRKSVLGKKAIKYGFYEKIADYQQTYIYMTPTQIELTKTKAKREKER